MDGRTRRLLAWTGVVLVSLASAGLFMALRVRGIGDIMPTFLGACQRIYDSGLPPVPGDRFCTLPSWHVHANYALNSLMIALGLALACMVLAATGRRWWSFIPLLGAPLVTYPIQSGWLFSIGSEPGRGAGAIASVLDLAVIVVPAVVLDRFVRRNAAVDAKRLPLLRLLVVGGYLVGSAGLIAVATPLFAFKDSSPSWSTPGNLLANLALIAAPSIALILAMQRPRRIPSVGSRRDRAAAAAVCAAGCALVILVAARYLTDHTLNIFDSYSSDLLPRAALLAGAAVVIGLFGALLGRNRSWWPWSIFAVAILLSQGPSFIEYFETPIEFKDIWSFYGSAVPLALVGLIGSAWQPLTARLARRRDPAAAAAAHRTADGRVLRPVVMVNAIALGLLIVAQIMFVSDPLPAEIGTSLPTFLGVRQRANEARAMMNVGDALDATDRYVSAHGSLEGFDAAAGERLAPALGWTDGVPFAPNDAIFPTPLWQGVIPGGRGDVQIVSVDRERNWYCVRTNGRSATFGRSRFSGDDAMPDDLLARCTSTLWSPDLIRQPPELECDEGTSFLICRMVQVLVHNGMTTPDPSVAG